MTKTIESTNKKWTFEIYDKNTDIGSETPTLFLLANKFPTGHNSNFPFTPLAGYRTDNPNSTFNVEPTFAIEKDKVILLLTHNYENIETQLGLALELFKTYYEVPYYDCQTGKEI
jgi:hypothetical protein